MKYFLVPNVQNFSWMTVVAAMGQMFYSLSIAMGILITFGSYMKKDTSIEGATRNVEVFDTAIAIMAGLMIIPAVFAFSGGDAKTLQAGSALMFITIPKVLQVWVLELLQGLRSCLSRFRRCLRIWDLEQASEFCSSCLCYLLHLQAQLPSRKVLLRHLRTSLAGDGRSQRL